VGKNSPKLGYLGYPQKRGYPQRRIPEKNQRQTEKYGNNELKKINLFNHFLARESSF